MVPRFLRRIFTNFISILFNSQVSREIPRYLQKSFFYKHISVGSWVKEEEKTKLYEKISNTWTKLGQLEPHWSVITNEKFKKQNLNQNHLEFNLSGTHSAERIIAAMERMGLNRKFWFDKSLVELGCGVGRVTIPLSSTFGRIKAIDISKPHLEILEEEISSKQITNIDLIQLNQLNVIQKLDPIDFFYSEITLQHNSPPIQRELLENMLKKIKKKGYFYFQIPTYIPNYEFNLEKYLKIENEKMEMHMLPMNQIFEIVYESNCRILNVIRDTSTGLEIESHTFIGIKND